MKNKFNSDGSLPLNKPLKFHNITITIRSAFKKDDKIIHKFLIPVDDTSR